jgi:tetratricopeptide (TPR) repeat protein
MTDQTPPSNNDTEALLAAQEQQEIMQAAIRFAVKQLQQGEIDDAIIAFERLYAVTPENEDIALNLSAAYILRKQFRKAVPVLETLRDQHPDNAMIYTNLGAAYLGNPVLATDEMQLQAIEAFKHALTLNPSAPNVAYNIGLIYKDRRETDEAIYWFQRALRVNSADKDARAWIRKLKENANT